MDFKKVGFIGTAVLVMGSFAMAASNAPRNLARVANPVPVLKRTPVQAHEAGVPAVSQAVAPAQMGKLELVPPPAELPKAASHAMVTSVTPVAPAAPKSASVDARVLKLAQDVLGNPKGKGKAAVAASPVLPTHASRAVPPAAKVKPQAAVAPARKPGKLFSYVRMLNFSPHPQQEEFLKDKPINMMGNNYHIDVSYNEDWKMISDEDGFLKKIGFSINLYENGKVVRTLKTPPVALDPKSIHKGQVLALAEVAPYKFNVAVDSFTGTPEGIKELVFKFDMTN